MKLNTYSKTIFIRKLHNIIILMCISTNVVYLSQLISGEMRYIWLYESNSWIWSVTADQFIAVMLSRDPLTPSIKIAYLVCFYYYIMNRCRFSWGGESHLFTWRLHVQQVEEVIHICLHSSGASMFSRLKR